ncbi:MAG: BTAD domain-containing putative transcriptional regulator [Trueperaceae bacterium]|nr:BTAD domain-containing putative transcriptional regulator [Trueperaceae bacterium]
MADIAVRLLRLLGAPTVEVDGRREPLPFTTPTSLLLYLAVAGDWVSRYELAFLFRPDEPETVALQYLRLQLHRAQRAPWALGLEIGADQLRWAPASDLASFDAAFASKDWGAVVDAYGGPLLASFAMRDKPTFETWLELERDGVEQRYRTALERRAMELAERGALSEAADLLGRRARLDTLDEAATVAYLEALGRIGRKADARRHYDGFVALLRDELDAVPAEATRTLMERIDAGDVEDAAPARSPSRDTVPQPATRFVGRRSEVAELEQRLAQDDCRLLTIVGLGGTGKTTACRPRAPAPRAATDSECPQPGSREERLQIRRHRLIHFHPPSLVQQRIDRASPAYVRPENLQRRLEPDTATKPEHVDHRSSRTGHANVRTEVILDLHRRAREQSRLDVGDLERDELQARTGCTRRKRDPHRVGRGDRQLVELGGREETHDRMRNAGAYLRQRRPLVRGRIHALVHAARHPPNTPPLHESRQIGPGNPELGQVPRPHETSLVEESQECGGVVVGH